MVIFRFAFSLLLLALVPVFGQCQSLKNQSVAQLVKRAKKNTCSDDKILTGIAGKVVEMKGNFMPGKGKDNSHKQQAVSRTVLIYPLVTEKDMVASGKEGEKAFYKSAKKNSPVASVQSDANGCFKVALKPGRYSLFVIEKGMLYGSIQDGDGFINPFNVQPEELTPFDVAINWQASF